MKKIQGKDNKPPSEKPADKSVPGKDALGNPIANVVGKAADLAVGAKSRKVTIVNPNSLSVIEGHFFIGAATLCVH